MQFFAFPLMATVLEEPPEATTTTERQEGDALTRLEGLRGTLSPGRMQELFDKACDSLLTSLGRFQNSRHPLPPTTKSEVLEVFATRVAKTYRDLDASNARRYEEQELFRHAFAMASETIAGLFCHNICPVKEHSDPYSPAQCEEALGLFDRQVKDGFLDPVSFDTHSDERETRVRTSRAYVEKLIVQCFDVHARILYILRCAHMHVDYVLSQPRLSAQEVAQQQWGAWENLGMAEELIERCEGVGEKDAPKLRHFLDETRGFVFRNLGGGPRANTA